MTSYIFVDRALNSSIAFMFVILFSPSTGVVSEMSTCPERSVSVDATTHDDSTPKRDIWAVLTIVTTPLNPSLSSSTRAPPTAANSEILASDQTSFETSFPILCL